MISKNVKLNSADFKYEINETAPRPQFIGINVTLKICIVIRNDESLSLHIY